MKWDIFLLIFSLLTLLFYAIAGPVIDVATADAIAEQLAPRIGVNGDLLRSNLRDMLLESGQLGRPIVYYTPWAIFSVLFIVRIFAGKKRRNGDIYLLIFSLAMLLFYAIGGITRDIVGSSNIAGELAHRIGANEDIIRSNLYDILSGSGRLGRPIIYCTPWAIFNVLLIVRILVEKRRSRTCSGLDRDATGHQ